MIIASATVPHWGGIGSIRLSLAMLIVVVVLATAAPIALGVTVDAPYAIGSKTVLCGLAVVLLTGLRWWRRAGFLALPGRRAPGLARPAGSARPGRPWSRSGGSRPGTHGADARRRPSRSRRWGTGFSEEALLQGRAVGVAATPGRCVGDHRHDTCVRGHPPRRAHGRGNARGGTLAQALLGGLPLGLAFAGSEAVTRSIWLLVVIHTVNNFTSYLMSGHWEAVSQDTTRFALVGVLQLGLVVGAGRPRRPVPLALQSSRVTLKEQDRRVWELVPGLPPRRRTAWACHASRARARGGRCRRRRARVPRRARSRRITRRRRTCDSRRAPAMRRREVGSDPSRPSCSSPSGPSRRTSIRSAARSARGTAQASLATASGICSTNRRQINRRIDPACAPCRLTRSLLGENWPSEPGAAEKGDGHQRFGVDRAGVPSVAPPRPDTPTSHARKESSDVRRHRGDWADQAIRLSPGGGRPQLQRRPGGSLRLPRPERCRQDDDDPPVAGGDPSPRGQCPCIRFRHLVAGNGGPPQPCLPGK